jgi:hypothetical protein
MIVTAPGGSKDTDEKEIILRQCKHTTECSEHRKREKP